MGPVADTGCLKRQGPLASSERGPIGAVSRPYLEEGKARPIMARAHLRG